MGKYDKLSKIKLIFSKQFESLSNFSKFKFSSKNLYLVTGIVLLICIYFHVKNKQLKKVENFEEQKLDLEVENLKENDQLNEPVNEMEKIDEPVKPEVRIEYRNKPGFISIPNQVYKNIQEQNQQLLQKIKLEEQKLISINTRLNQELSNQDLYKNKLEEKEEKINKLEFSIDQHLKIIKDRDYQIESFKDLTKSLENDDESNEINDDIFEQDDLTKEENIQNYINSISESTNDHVLSDEEDDRIRQQDLTSTEIMSIQTQLNSMIN